jgi:hypothetical protein
MAARAGVATVATAVGSGSIMGLGHSSVVRLLASMRIGAEMDGEPQRTVCRPAPTDRGPHATTVHLDGLPQARDLTLTDLADLVGITIADLPPSRTAKPKPSASPHPEAVPGPGLPTRRSPHLRPGLTRFHAHGDELIKRLAGRYPHPRISSTDPRSSALHHPRPGEGGPAAGTPGAQPEEMVRCGEADTATRE